MPDKAESLSLSNRPVGAQLPADNFHIELDKTVNEKIAAAILGRSVYWMQKKRWEGGGPRFSKTQGRRTETSTSKG